MTKKEFIRQIIEGGYVPEHHIEQFKQALESKILGELSFQSTILNPLSWKAIAKSKGWDKDILVSFHGIKAYKQELWIFHMHKMIDYLIAGKTIEEFLETL